jgi:hypothetical protein
MEICLEKDCKEDSRPDIKTEDIKDHEDFEESQNSTQFSVANEVFEGGQTDNGQIYTNTFNYDLARKMHLTGVHQYNFDTGMGFINILSDAIRQKYFRVVSL